MSTSSSGRSIALTNNGHGRKVGRRLGGSYGRPCKDRHPRANRGVRRSIKNLLRVINL